MSENNKKRSSRMSKPQKELLIARLEKDKFLLLQTTMRPSELPKYNYGWNRLAEDLNALQGAKKCVSKWKDALNELKVNTRRRARILNQEACGTGGGPKVEKELTDIEQRLLALLSKISITGSPDVPEAGLATVTTQERSRECSQDVLIENNNAGFILDLENADIEFFNDETVSDITDIPIDTQSKILPPRQPETEPDASKSSTTGTTGPSRSRHPQKSKRKNNSDLEDVAIKHKKCLEDLSSSNVTLAIC